MSVRAPTSRVQLPDTSEIEDPSDKVDLGTVRRYLARLNTAVTRALESRVEKDQPSAQVLLLSPTNKVYAVTVNDAGVISATLVLE